MLHKLPIYDLSTVILTGQIEGTVFRALKTEDNGLQTVIGFRANSKKLLEDFEARWIPLCDGDVFELTEWANRMRFINQMFDEIDRNLAVKNTRLFDWDRVGTAMGYINAFRTVVEQVLDHSEYAECKVA